MVGYARRQAEQGQHQQALDVLRSGVGMPGVAGLDAARLLLATAELAAQQCEWAEAAATAERAAAMVAGDEQPRGAALVLSAARLLQARALLAGGDDAGAAALAGGLAADGGVGGAAGRGTSLMLLHALGDEAAAKQAAHALHAHLKGPQQLQGAPDAAAALAAAHWQGASGDPAAAQALYDRAAAAAAEAEGGSEGGGEPLLAPWVARELRSDALLGLAQVHCAGKRWEEGEQAAGAALAAAEAAGGEGSALLAPALGVLGWAYSRTGRVTFAEGMFREAAKLAGLDPGRRPASGRAGALHPSLAAAIAWRHAQLLTALPKRDSEAGSWAAYAQTLWSEAGVGAGGGAPPGLLTTGSLNESLGDLAALTGKGAQGRGAIMTSFARRLLPVLPAA